MHLPFINPRIVRSVDRNGKEKMSLHLDVPDDSASDFIKAADYILHSKTLCVDIDREYSPRSVNANSLFWHICGRIASVLRIPSDEVYISLVKDYGVSSITTVSADEADDMERVMKESSRIVVRLGNVKIAGEDYVQFRVYKGTHLYNTRQMSVLIDGALQEAENVGTPVEVNKNLIDRVKKEWNSDSKPLQ